MIDKAQVFLSMTTIQSQGERSEVLVFKSGSWMQDLKKLAKSDQQPAV